MMKSLGTMISILVLAATASAHSIYEPIDTVKFSANPENYDGRMVEARAEVVAISADSKRLELFDAKNRMTIFVNLASLSKAQRSAIINSPVRNVLVYGRATVSGTKIVIDADKVEALLLDSKDRIQ
jgi:hypothetical protein